MIRAALTMTAIFLIAVESPAEERSLRVDFVGTVNHPPSPAIRNLIIHPERISVGDGDNWPITWADDGHQYTVYCDGKGFGGGSGEGSMSLARIVGEPPDFSGENLHRQPATRKAAVPKDEKPADC